MEEKNVWDKVAKGADEIRGDKKKITVACIVGIIVVVVVGWFAIIASMYVDGNGIFYRLPAGSYAVIESSQNGTRVVEKPYVYGKWLGTTITTYPISKTYRFGGWRRDGDDSHEIQVQFSDGEKGIVNAILQVDLPKDRETRLKLHYYLQSKEGNLREDISNEVLDIANNVAETMTALESSHSSGWSDFRNQLHAQIKYGKFKMIECVEQAKDPNEKDIIRKSFAVSNGSYILDKKATSFMSDYNIKPTTFIAESIKYTAVFSEARSREAAFKRHIIRKEMEIKTFKLEKRFSEKQFALDRLHLDLRTDFEIAKIKAKTMIAIAETENNKTLLSHNDISPEKKAALQKKIDDKIEKLEMEISKHLTVIDNKYKELMKSMIELNLKEIQEIDIKIQANENDSLPEV